MRELEERRAAIIASINEQNKMTPELLDAISDAEDKTRLEDLYLPYKPKRRTKAQIALEAGLLPLAEALLANPMLNPELEAAKVKVLEVDEKRKRIALTMRLADSAAESAKGGAPHDHAADAKRLMQHKRREERQPAPDGAMAAAFAKLKG